MATKLPLALKVSIRDNTTLPTCKLQKTLSSLTSTTGTPLTLNLDWDTLYRDLLPSFTDKPALIGSSIAETLSFFLTRLTSKLESDESFSDQYLSSRIGDVRVVVIKGDEARVMIREKSLYLEVIARSPFEWRVNDNQIDMPTFLESMFATSEPWEDVADVVPGAAATTQPIIAASPAALAGARRLMKVLCLPQESHLQKPDELFAKLLPYILIVRQTSNHVLEVEGSHPATLQLIANYFEKYAARNSNGRPEIVRHTGMWGNGTMLERVSLKWPNARDGWIKFGISVLLSFVEGVCGYSPTGVHQGDYHFRRDEPL
ncbi:hypothetical protein EX30DRAFT_342155 [Ascodesmis nigricans]|uniref:Uncharacterized protein n=1 Tax=Ascodesmis nigricans TaxID=341454 RepID=A0A4V3SIE2_9PEZI|nr:hypothetical protein EX30DRAFT_342155 [Ascodesmis nigricans]